MRKFAVLLLVLIPLSGCSRDKNPQDVITGSLDRRLVEYMAQVGVSGFGPAFAIGPPIASEGSRTRFDFNWRRLGTYNVGDTIHFTQTFGQDQYFVDGPRLEEYSCRFSVRILADRTTEQAAGIGLGECETNSTNTECTIEIEGVVWR
jgi:hypothetical protein